MAECEKIIKRDAFLKAIEVEDAPSAAEGLDIEHMALEKDYKGPVLGDKMTLEFIEDMIEKFKTGQKLAKKYAFKIIVAVMEIVKNEPTMVEHDVEEGCEITVCGDTHGMSRANIRASSANHVKVNTLIFLTSSSLPVTHRRRTPSFSTVTLLIEVLGRRRLRCSCMLTRCCTPPNSS
jgi:hypothetical protein